MNKYYITTAINYTNGPPHIGHCYEAVISDFLARFHRLIGFRVRFLTGTDEHGLKIANTAKAIGKKPIEICNKYATQFQELAHNLDLSHDFFIRTTMILDKIEWFQLVPGTKVLKGEFLFRKMELKKKIKKDLVKK